MEARVESRFLKNANLKKAISDVPTSYHSLKVQSSKIIIKPLLVDINHEHARIYTMPITLLSN